MFTIGIVGVLTRRNAIIIFMCIELMLNSVNLTFVAFSSYLGNTTGQVIVFFVMAVAAAEAAVGLAIVLSFYRLRASVDSGQEQRTLRERLAPGLRVGP